MSDASTIRSDRKRQREARRRGVKEYGGKDGLARHRRPIVAATISWFAAVFIAVALISTSAAADGSFTLARLLR
jgi:hypothetical protein